MSVEKHPRHVAIILDGNRRFAKKLMLEPWKGHEFGQKKVEQLLEWCKDAGIKELTLYAFSMQNFNRPKEEFDYLMKIFRESFDKFYTDKRIGEYSIKVNILGRYELFPKDIFESMRRIVEKTKDNSKFILNFAVAYGGREELIDTIKKIISKHPEPEEITEEYVAENLYMHSDPDIIIRTGGEKRTSNFLPWQSVYSEWFFIDKTWPEFEKEDLKMILGEYKQRERRFGK
jgi:tritrans,polycis-undecaprenyl-diphosphate synthase [geranylgeranyl-diphosphate specific]